MRWALGRVRAKREFTEGGRKGGFAPATGTNAKRVILNWGWLKLEMRVQTSREN